jgi:hypothetical protein
MLCLKKLLAEDGAIKMTAGEIQSLSSFSYILSAHGLLFLNHEREKKPAKFILLFSKQKFPLPRGSFILSTRIGESRSVPHPNPDVIPPL